MCAGRQTPVRKSNIHGSRREAPPAAVWIANAGRVPAHAPGHHIRDCRDCRDCRWAVGLVDQSAFRTEAENLMLYTIAVILLVLWLLGLVSSTTIGGFIHILLVIAIVLVLLRVISGRKVL